MISLVETKLKGAFIIEPERKEDDRGFFGALSMRFKTEIWLSWLSKWHIAGKFTDDKLMLKEDEWLSGDKLKITFGTGNPTSADGLQVGRHNCRGADE